MQARIALVPQPQQRRETESIKSPRSTIKITLLRTLQRDVFVSNRNDNFRENPRRSRRQLNKRRKEAQKDQITRFAEKKTEGLKKYYKNLDQEASIAQVLDSNHNNGNQPLPFQFHENMETLQFQENVSSSDDDCDILSSEIHGLELYECEAYSTLDVDSSLDMMMQFLEC